MEQQRNDGKETADPRLLENLIPLAVVIACGCEPCAESCVRRALAAGSSRREIQKALAIIQHMKTVGCLIERVGSETVGRMESPLAAAARIMKEFQAEPAQRAPRCC